MEACHKLIIRNSILLKNLFTNYNSVTTEIKYHVIMKITTDNIFYQLYM